MAQNDTSGNRRLEFGFSVFPFSRFRHVEEAVEVAQLGEELGFDTCAIPEHLLTPTWPTAGMHTKYWFDQPSIMAYLAGKTTRLQFLTSVMVIPYHPPVQMAKALATVDVLSGGRVRLGTGSGWMEAEFKRLQIPYAERGAITDEYLRAMRELWTSETPSFQGKYVSFDRVSFHPKPVQDPLPIWIGGIGPRPFQRAAELGQGWIPMTASVDDLRSGRAEIEKQMRALGRDPSELAVSFNVSMGTDPERESMSHSVDGSVAEELPAHRTPTDAIRAVEELRDAGVTHVGAAVPWTNAEELKAELRQFATEVMPAFA